MNITTSDYYCDCINNIITNTIINIDNIIDLGSTKNTRYIYNNNKVNDNLFLFLRDIYDEVDSNIIFFNLGQFRDKYHHNKKFMYELFTYERCDNLAKIELINILLFLEIAFKSFDSNEINLKYIELSNNKTLFINRIIDYNSDNIWINDTKLGFKYTNLVCYEPYLSIKQMENNMILYNKITELEKNNKILLNEINKLKNIKPSENNKINYDEIKKNNYRLNNEFHLFYKYFYKRIRKSFK